MLLDIFIYLIGCLPAYMFAVSMAKETNERFELPYSWWNDNIAIIFVVVYTLFSWFGAMVIALIKWAWNIKKYWFIFK